jgi:hypothetical protein
MYGPAMRDANREGKSDDFQNAVAINVTTSGKSQRSKL